MPDNLTMEGESVNGSVIIFFDKILNSHGLDTPLFT